MLSKSCGSSGVGSRGVRKITGRVGSGRVGSGRVGSGREVFKPRGSGRVTLTQSDLGEKPCSIVIPRGRSEAELSELFT